LWVIAVGVVGGQHIPISLHLGNPSLRRTAIASAMACHGTELSFLDIPHHSSRDELMIPKLLALAMAEDDLICLDAHPHRRENDILILLL
jgi:hypothetical protein